MNTIGLFYIVNTQVQWIKKILSYVFIHNTALQKNAKERLFVSILSIVV